MVGMLVADKTPLKPRKLTNLQSKKRKNEKQGLNLRNDDTDSEEEESSRKHNMKRGKRIIDDEDEKIEIFLPTNLTFLKRYVLDLSVNSKFKNVMQNFIFLQLRIVSRTYYLIYLFVYSILFYFIPTFFNFFYSIPFRIFFILLFHPFFHRYYTVSGFPIYKEK